MVFRRIDSPGERLSDAALTRAMNGIGMNFGGRRAKAPPIEDTLYWASYVGLVEQDYRVLDVLNTWLEIHCEWLNVSRVVRLLKAQREPVIAAFWAAFAQTQSTDPRFKALAKLAPKRALKLPGVSDAFQLKRHGEDTKYKGTCFKVHAKFFRRRSSDVLSPAQLAKIHPVYKTRIEQGPSFRADMWATASEHPEWSAAEIARVTHGSYATASGVLRDWRIVNG